MKIIHTKDGRTLYKDDEGHWLKKDAAEKLLALKNENKSSDVRDPEKDEQIKKGEANSKLLNGPTYENAYGFEVTTKEDRPVTFTEFHWKKMAELRKKGQFRYGDLRDEVKRKADELYLSNEYGDMWSAIAEEYGEDVASLYEHIEYDYITDDEYWAGWHLLAEWMGIKK